MFKKFYRAIFTILGMLCGVGVSFIVSMLVGLAVGGDNVTKPVFAGICIVCIIITALIFFLIAPPVLRSLERAAHEIDEYTKKVPVNVLICSVIGLILGLIIASLISNLWSGLTMAVPALGTALSILVYIFLGYLGFYLAYKKSGEIITGVKSLFSIRGAALGRNAGKSKSTKDRPAPKILDTSVIIDGRILDIMKTGFIEGKIVIPEFVLVELRHVSDSSDTLKRNRGRRGLDILTRIREQYGIEIYDSTGKGKVDEAEEVDVKLLELAAAIGGKVVTNDYNLNKVAALKGVDVLNINELANTLKPAVLPGEELELELVREGKEAGQALAYLDDGTMIVVENAKHLIGTTVNAVVTSVLQTSAGRMIFAKPRL